MKYYDIPMDPLKIYTCRFIEWSFYDYFEDHHEWIVDYFTLIFKTAAVLILFASSPPDW